MAELDWLEEETTGAGVDNGASDTNHASLVLAQSNSSFVLKGSPDYIQGAEAGSIVNMLKKEAYAPDVGIDVISVGYERFVRVRKDDESAFFAPEVRQQLVANAQRTDDGLRLPNGAMVDDICRHYVIYRRSGDDSFVWQPAVLSMNNGKMAGAKEINNIILNRFFKSKKLDRWATVVRITSSLSTEKRRNKTMSWYSFKIEDKGQQGLTKEVYRQGKEFFEVVNSIRAENELRFLNDLHNPLIGYNRDEKPEQKVIEAQVIDDDDGIPF